MYLICHMVIWKLHLVVGHMVHYFFPSILSEKFKLLESSESVLPERVAPAEGQEDAGGGEAEGRNDEDVCVPDLGRIFD